MRPLAYLQNRIRDRNRLCRDAAIKQNGRLRRKPSFEALEARVVFDAGEIDTSFGDEGFVFLDFAGRLDFANAVAAQPDGMTLVAGQAGRLEGFDPHMDLAVVRLTEDGDLDPEFGEEGIALLDFGDSNGSANNIAIQEDGNIVVAGEIQPNGGFVLLRFDSTGTLDSLFNGSGLFTSDLSSRANDLVIQSDRKIVVVGDAEGPLGFQIFLARFNEDGSLDEMFDEDGVLFTPVLVADGSAQAVALQDDGKIVVAGYGTSDETNLSSFFIARYLGDGGSLDSDFGGDGLIHTTITTDSRATDVAIDDQGRIVVTGSDNGDFVLVRYNDDGSLDDSFSGGGVVTIAGLNPVIDGTTGGSVMIQPDGKIVATASGGNDFVVLRFESDGDLDPTFNGVGKVVASGLSFDSSEAVALHDDGRIVVAGISGGDWAAARFFGDSAENAPAWQNPIVRFDVNDDGNVVPLDVLRIINELNQRSFSTSTGQLPSTRPEGAPFFDVDGNGFATPLDVLGVINFLNNGAGVEGEAGSSEQVIDVIFEEFDGMAALEFLLVPRNRLRLPRLDA